MAENKKHFKKVDAVVFLETQERLKLDVGQLSEALGYSTSAGSGWVSEGKMPQVAALACEALIKRQPRTDEEGVFVFLKLERGVVAFSRCVTDPATMHLGEQDYYLIPKRKEVK